MKKMLLGVCAALAMAAVTYSPASKADWHITVRVPNQGRNDVFGDGTFGGTCNYGSGDQITSCLFGIPTWIQDLAVQAVVVVMPKSSCYKPGFRWDIQGEYFDFDAPRPNGSVVYPFLNIHQTYVRGLDRRVWTFLPHPRIDGILLTMVNPDGTRCLDYSELILQMPEWTRGLFL